MTLIYGFILQFYVKLYACVSAVCVIIIMLIHIQTIYHCIYKDRDIYKKGIYNWPQLW